MPVNIKVEKKHLYLLSAILIFLVGVGVVIALNSGNYQVHGHTADEIQGGGGGGGGVSLGAWVDLTSSTQDNVVYGPVTSDGFILAYTGQNDHIGAYTGSTNPPTRHVLQQNVAVSGSGVSHVTFPVKKGDYWKIDMYWGTIGGVYWIPLLGSGVSEFSGNCQWVEYPRGGDGRNCDATVTASVNSFNTAFPDANAVCSCDNNDSPCRINIDNKKFFIGSTQTSGCGNSGSGGCINKILFCHI